MNEFVFNGPDECVCCGADVTKYRRLLLKIDRSLCADCAAKMDAAGGEILVPTTPTFTERMERMAEERPITAGTPTLLMRIRNFFRPPERFDP